MTSFQYSPIPSVRRSREVQLRRTVLSLFASDANEATVRLRGAERDEWRRLLRWLDSSGMALYLLTRMQELEIDFLLPAPLYARLQQNVADNGCRIDSIVNEMSDVASRFRAAGVEFAFLKGLTLVPHSVPDPTLRCQSDLDLIAPQCFESRITDLLAARGYILHASGNGTSEFKTASTRLPSPKEIYNVPRQKVLEVHWIDEGGSEITRASVWAGQLRRAEFRMICGVRVPCLSPVDQFLSQASHLFSHLCSEHTRASWVLEFKRHMETRRHDPMFWQELKHVSSEVPQSRLALGVSCAVARAVFQSDPPGCLASCMDELPVPVLQWIRAYALRTVVADAPGSKLYLLLEAALAPAATDTTRFVRRRLLPRRLPPMLMRGSVDEPLSQRLRRYTAQLWFIAYRLRFHLRELPAYCVERIRWKKLSLDPGSAARPCLQTSDNQSTAA